MKTYPDCQVILFTQSVKNVKILTGVFCIGRNDGEDDRIQGRVEGFTKRTRTNKDISTSINRKITLQGQ